MAIDARRLGFNVSALYMLVAPEMPAGVDAAANIRTGVPAN
jgi:hypothetical protein